MFAKMKTGTKILAGFAIAIAITVVVGTIGYRGIGKVAFHANEIGTNYLPSVRGLNLMAKGQLNVSFADRGLTERRMMDKDVRETQYKRIEDGMKMADMGRKMYEPLTQQGEEAVVWKEFVGLWDDWCKKQEKIVALSREKDDLVRSGLKLDDPKVLKLDDEVFAAAEPVRQAFIKSAEKLDEVIKLNVKYSDEEVKQTASDTAYSVATMLSAIGLGAVLMLILGIVLAKSIAKVLTALIGEANRLTEAAVGGRLQTRGNPELVSLEFRPIVEGVNATLDAVVGPLNVAAEYVDRISKGDIPPKITDTYQRRLQRNQEQPQPVHRRVNGLIGEAKTLVQGGRGWRAGRRGRRQHATRASIREIIRGMNKRSKASSVPSQDIARRCNGWRDKDFTAAVDHGVPRRLRRPPRQREPRDHQHAGGDRADHRERRPVRRGLADHRRERPDPRPRRPDAERQRARR